MTAPGTRRGEAKWKRPGHTPGPGDANPHYGRVQNRDGRVIVDEQCACGHSRAMHAGSWPVAGHGACEAAVDGHRLRECRCARFTWERFVTVTPRQFARLAKATEATP